MAQALPDYTSNKKGFWDYVQQMYFPTSTQPVYNPYEVESGAPQGATQSDLNTQNLIATGQLPAAGGTVNVSGEGGNAPVIPPIANPYADPNYQAMQEQMYQKIQDSIAAQKLSEQDAAKLLKDFLGQEQEMDLSPLLAWVDSSYGTNLSKGYQKPMTREERLVKSADLQDLLRKAGAGVTDKEIELLRAKMGDKKAEAEILANMQYRRDLLAKQNKPKTLADLTARDQVKFKESYQKDYGNKISDFGKARGFADNIQNIIEQKGGRPGWLDDDRKMFESSISNLVLKYNTDFANLGALAGPDLEILERALGVKVGSLTDDYLANLISDPTGVKTKDIMQKFKNVFDKAAQDEADKAVSIYGDLVKPMVQEDLARFRSMSSVIGGRKYEAGEKSTSDPRIDSFMKKNNIKDRNQAIEILKKAGKI